MFKTINGSEFTITGADDRQIGVSIPQNPISNKLLLNVEEIRKMLESDTEFTVTLAQPTPYFKFLLSEPVYYPLDQKVVDKRFK